MISWNIKDTKKLGTAWWRGVDAGGVVAGVGGGNERNWMLDTNYTNYTNRGCMGDVGLTRIQKSALAGIFR